MSLENVEVVKGMYDAFAKGEIPGVVAALDTQVEWWEAENFIYDDGNPYIGPDAVLQGVFMRIGTEWVGFAVSPKEVLDAGIPLLAMVTTAEPTKRMESKRVHSLRTSLRFAMGKS